MVFGLFNAKVKATHFLVCSIHDKTRLELLPKEDAVVYRKYYPNVTIKSISDGGALIQEINLRQFDVVRDVCGVK